MRPRGRLRPCGESIVIYPAILYNTTGLNADRDFIKGIMAFAAPAMLPAFAGRGEKSVGKDGINMQDTTPLHPGQTVLYQIAPERDSLMMSYVIKTQNDQVIVVDGGIDGVGRDRPVYLLDALRVITGKTRPVISGWFFTHSHTDHLHEFVKMVQTEKEQFRVEAFYFNLPDESVLSRFDPDALGIYQRFSAAYCAYVGNANAMEQYRAWQAVKPGMRISIDNAETEILQIWDASDPTTNDTSTVFRVSVNGKKILFLGDLGTAGGRRLCNTYGDGLASDLVQMAHHGQNGVRRPVYEAIRPAVCLWPTPIWVWENRDAAGIEGKGIYETTTVREWMGALDTEAADFNKRHIVSAYLAKRDGESWQDALKRMAVILPAG